MKRISFSLSFLLIFLLGYTNLHAYWEWTPETGKWINPKYAPKETAEEQFKYAQNFFQEGEYKIAIREFRKTVKYFPTSPYAAEAQFYIGECFYRMRKPLEAAQEYQVIIDKFPSSNRIREVLERQKSIGDELFTLAEREEKGFTNIAKSLLSKSNAEKAISVYEMVLKNDPYNLSAAEVQYRIGLCYQSIGKYKEAIKAFQKVIDNYPRSQWVDDAYYQIALSSFSQSLEVPYDQTMTRRAREKLSEFEKRFPESEKAPIARKKRDSLEVKEAQKVYEIARFYEKQGYFKSAGIYYEEILKKYPQTPWAPLAREALKWIQSVEKGTSP